MPLSSISMATTNGKALLLGLRSPLALLMKLGVALVQLIQSGFDPHHGLDAEADLFPFVRAKHLNQLVALWQRRSWKVRSFKSCAILRPADFSPASRKSTGQSTFGPSLRRGRPESTFSGRCGSQPWTSE